MPASSCAETVRQIPEFLLQRRLGDLPGNERAEGYLRIAERGTGGEVPASMTTYARRLGIFSATMAVMGGIIGSGVFLGPQIVAARVGSAGLTLVAWVVGGVIALAGAFCFGELGARRPRAGGGYVYLREAFGPLPAFLYGWALLLVIATGATAAVAVTFASYTVALLGLSPAATLPLATAAIVLLSGVNYVGVKPAAVTQNVFTILKLAALAALVAAGLFAFRPNLPQPPPSWAAEEMSWWPSVPPLCPCCSHTGGGSKPTSSPRRSSSRSGACRAPSCWVWRGS